MFWMNAADMIKVITFISYIHWESTYSSKIKKNSHKSDIHLHKISKLQSSVINF